MGAGCRFVAAVVVVVVVVAHCLVLAVVLLAVLLVLLDQDPEFFKKLLRDKVLCERRPTQTTKGAILELVRVAPLLAACRAARAKGLRFLGWPLSPNLHLPALLFAFASFLQLPLYL